MAAAQQQYNQAEGIADQTNTTSAARHATFRDAVEEIDEFDGATVHMFNTNTVFVNLLVPEQASIVLLGDGVTSLLVKGIETATIYVNNKLIILPNSLYVPDLE
eukprot:12415137-Ditylum_brightwellii.AAC.1